MALVPISLALLFMAGVAVAAVTTPWMLLRLARKRKGRRVWTACFISWLLIIGTVVLMVAQERSSAVGAGFASLEDQQAAKKAGYTEAAGWKAHKDEVAAYEAAAAEKARKEAAEAEEAAAQAKIQAEADCRQNVACWGDRHNIAASAACQPVIEQMAKIDFKWTDGWLEPKFSHYAWKDQKAGVVAYLGDKIQYQNGFGAWVRHAYECDFNTEAGIVVDAQADPGHL